MSDILITEWGQGEDRIRELEAQIAALTAERDRYRAALEKYANPLNWTEDDRWMPSDNGPDVAEKALAGESESEAK